MLTLEEPRAESYTCEPSSSSSGVLIYGGTSGFPSRLTKKKFNASKLKRRNRVLPMGLSWYREQACPSKAARPKKPAAHENSRVLKLRIQTVPVRIAHTFVCGSPLCTFKWRWTAHRHE